MVNDVVVDEKELRKLQGVLEIAENGFVKYG